MRRIVTRRQGLSVNNRESFDVFPRLSEFERLSALSFLPLQFSFGSLRERLLRGGCGGRRECVIGRVTS